MRCLWRTLLFSSVLPALLGAGCNQQLSMVSMISLNTALLTDTTATTQELLSAEPGRTSARDPSLVLDGAGNPWVAWQESDGSTSNIYVRRWDGTAWRAVGGALSAEPGRTNARNPSLVLDGSGNPWVAWQESDGSTSNIYVRRWDGFSWRPVGGALSAEPGNTGASNPSLAVDAAGNFWVTWSERGGSSANNIYVRRWDGTTWRAVGEALSATPGDTIAFSPSLVLDANGDPWIAWGERGDSVNDIYVRRWDGTTWRAVGEALSAAPGSGTNALAPSLALDANGNPWVAWSESDGSTGNIYVRRWDGIAWRAAGEELSAEPGSTNALDPSLVFDSTGDPWVAWDESDGSTSNIYLRRWDGTAWRAVGEALSAEPGSTNAFSPSLVLDATGNLWVAWDEWDGSASNIYVQRYDVPPRGAEPLAETNAAP